MPSQSNTWNDVVGTSGPDLRQVRLFASACAYHLGVTSAVVLIGGAMPDRSLLHGVADADIIVAVDSGVRIARSHGLPVHWLIGDLDSASSGDRAWAEAESATVIEHPADKDATDLELALDHLGELGAETIVALGVEGGRIDHELGNWAILSRTRAALIEIRTSTGVAHVLHGAGVSTLSLEGDVGDVVTLLPRGGPAHRVTTTGLRWALDAATLEVGTTRGVSNEFIEAEATVSVEKGSLLIVRPDRNFL